MRAPGISAGAKLAYGRLARYAGQDGRCYPSVAKLAGEIGVRKRQAQKYLAELEREKLIRRASRFAGPTQTSNDIEFLWHSLFEEGVNFRSREGVNNRSPTGVNDRSPKESQIIKESHLEESHNNDLDYPPTNRKNRDSLVGSVFVGAGPRQYPELRETLAGYMTVAEDEERVYPSDRQVVDVMDAAKGATEPEVIHCLRYLYNERGLRPGTKHGPRHFSWFKTVVADYFLQRRDREFVANPPLSSAGEYRSRAGLSQADFDAMSAAFQIDEPQ